MRNEGGDNNTDTAPTADVLVVGGGHAGIEAAMAAARLGCSVIMMTMDADKIGQMSCNPAIGGTAKGHVVREIDAMGGVMARLIDRTGIQFRMLNRSKGPAIWSPRAQADRAAYRDAARTTIEAEPGIRIITDTVSDLIVDDGTLVGVVGEKTGSISCTTAVLAVGTFLRGLMHTGSDSTTGGRVGEGTSVGLSDGLRAVGLELGRLKTGTPPRVDGNTRRRPRLQAT
jgi:tRNA uridine 5-carboxymethylaminomethyl modification enzyme